MQTNMESSANEHMNQNSLQLQQPEQQNQKQKQPPELFQPPPQQSSPQETPPLPAVYQELLALRSAHRELRLYVVALANAFNEHVAALKDVRSSVQMQSQLFQRLAQQNAAQTPLLPTHADKHHPYNALLALRDSNPSAQTSQNHEPQPTQPSEKTESTMDQLQMAGSALESMQTARNQHEIDQNTAPSHSSITPSHSDYRSMEGSASEPELDDQEEDDDKEDIDFPEPSFGDGAGSPARTRSNRGRGSRGRGTRARGGRARGSRGKTRGRSMAATAAIAMAAAAELAASAEPHNIAASALEESKDSAYVRGRGRGGRARARGRGRGRNRSAFSSASGSSLPFGADPSDEATLAAWNASAQPMSDIQMHDASLMPIAAESIRTEIDHAPAVSFIPAPEPLKSTFPVLNSETIGGVAPIQSAPPIAAIAPIQPEPEISVGPIQPALPIAAVSAEVVLNQPAAQPETQTPIETATPHEMATERINKFLQNMPIDTGIQVSSLPITDFVSVADYLSKMTQPIVDSVAFLYPNKIHNHPLDQWLRESKTKVLSDMSMPTNPEMDVLRKFGSLRYAKSLCVKYLMTLINNPVMVGRTVMDIVIDYGVALNYMSVILQKFEHLQTARRSGTGQDQQQQPTQMQMVTNNHASNHASSTNESASLATDHVAEAGQLTHTVADAHHSEYEEILMSGGSATTFAHQT